MVFRIFIMSLYFFAVQAMFANQTNNLNQTTKNEIVESQFIEFKLNRIAVNQIVEETNENESDFFDDEKLVADFFSFFSTFNLNYNPINLSFYKDGHSTSAKNSVFRPPISLLFSI